jgi:hypothetical protein
VAEEVAPAFGGGIDALVAGVEEASVEVEEATDGVIIDTMPGAYFLPSQRNLLASREVDHEKS